MNGKKDIILIAAFGMGRAADYRATLDKLRQEIGNEWPDHLVYACATSGRMRAALAEQNLFLPAPEQVLSLFAGQGGRALTVLPTQLLPGADYARLTDAVRQNFAGPARLLPPLLGEETGRAALARHLAALPDGGGQTLWMGHGSEEGRADALYAQMEGALDAIAPGRHLVATAEGGRRLADLLPRLTGRRVLLRPLLFAAGHHARVDLAGDGADSWRRQLEERGYEVACNLTGLGEMEPVRALYRAQLRRALSER